MQFSNKILNIAFLIPIVLYFLTRKTMGTGPTKGFGDEASKIISKNIRHETISSKQETSTATFAGGCFWSVELAFQRVPGVLTTSVGYCQGHQDNPTYEEVCSGRTGHTEAVQLVFQPSVISYDELLTVFWDRIDPTTRNSQGNDFGTQYRSGIYYHSDEQREMALNSMRREQLKYSNQIVTEIEQVGTFYPAEQYHQQYLSKGGQCSKKGDLSEIRCYG